MVASTRLEAVCLPEALTVPSICLTTGRRAVGWPRTHRYLWLYSPPTEPFRAKSAHVAVGKWWGLRQSLGLLQAPVSKPGSMTINAFDADLIDQFPAGLLDEQLKERLASGLKARSHVQHGLQVCQ